MDNMDKTEQGGSQSQIPQTPQTSTPTPSQEQKTSWGPIIGLVIILALIIAGSFYFFSKDQNDTPVPPEPSIEDIESELLDLRTQGQSDELGDIEADLEATNLDNLDAEVGLIEEEL